MSDQVTVSRELLRQILGYVEEGNPGHIADRINVLVKLRAAIEQPAVEPVAWMEDKAFAPNLRPLYTAPQAQQPDARAVAIQECIDRLVQGGKPAEAGMLRHHFSKDLAP